MIDLKRLREETEQLREALGRKRFPAEEVDALLGRDAEVRRLKGEVEALRAERNAVSRRVGKSAPEERATLLLGMRRVADDLDRLEPELKRAEEGLHEAVGRVPNPPSPEAPAGAGDEANVELRRVGEPRAFAFPPLDHLEIGERRDWIDMPRAARASGARFAYLKRDLVDLEMALVRMALDRLEGAGFIPVVPPILVREAAMYGTGFFPADRNEIYKIEGEDSYLVGTSEVPLAALHMDEALDEAELPRRYAGFSTCLRREAGSYGRDTRGIFRVHQFDKVEMFSFCTPEQSEAEHQAILAIEEELLTALELPYRIVDVCAGDLGAPAARKFDLEAWMPGQQAYREVTSCSNCTDFQARRLGVRGRSERGSRPLHTLNGTAVAIGRTLIALLENHQREDVRVQIPVALRPYLGGRELL